MFIEQKIALHKMETTNVVRHYMPSPSACNLLLSVDTFQKVKDFFLRF